MVCCPKIPHGACKAVLSVLMPCGAALPISQLQESWSETLNTFPCKLHSVKSGLQIHHTVFAAATGLLLKVW